MSAPSASHCAGDDLRDQPPDPEPSRRAAQILWLQARSASAVPIIWSAENSQWEMGELPTADGQQRQKPAKAKGYNRTGGGGLVRPETMARRVMKIARVLARHHVTFHHGDLFDVIPAGDLTGHVYYLDPDYLGCTSYGFSVGRDRLLALALDLAARGVRVVISEAVPLPLPGWFHVEITRNKPVDHVIMAIVDEITVQGKSRFKKSDATAAG